MQDYIPEKDLKKRMFGYVTVNRPELKVKDLERYRSYYCGLCHMLGRRYSLKERLYLSYDCTFLVLLLSGVYEPAEAEIKVRCPRHPALKHPETVSRFTSYAADMNVLLAYFKAEDDWKDEKNMAARLTMLALSGDHETLKERWPRQEKALLDGTSGLAKIEKEGSPEGKDSILRTLDLAAGMSGHFLGEICAPFRDLWEEDLKGTGFYLGKFVYIMDAFDDMEKDRKSGGYNLLNCLEREDPEGFRDTVKEVLMDTAACCCRHFERLPIVKNVEILRNILYSGIWVKFNERSV